MILPEDTKEAVPSDDEYGYSYSFSDELEEEEEYLDYQDVLAARPHPATTYDDDDDEDTAHHYPYPLSPRSALTFPLLPHSDDNDHIELGPAPPYSARDEASFSRWTAWRRSRRRSRRDSKAWSKGRRLVMFGLSGVLGWLVLLGVGSLVFRGHRPRGGRWRGGRPAAGDWNREDVRGDGGAVECVDFGSLKWTGMGGEGGGESTANMTFWLPGEVEAFAHLAGPAAVGDVFIEGYDDDGVRDAGDVVAKPVGKEGTGRGGGEEEGWVKVVVQPVVREEVGKAWFDAGRVCLMDKRLGNSSAPAAAGKQRRKRRGMDDDEPPPPPPHPEGGDDGLGVGVYTRAPPTTATPSDTLKFNIFVYLPRSSPSLPPSSLSSKRPSGKRANTPIVALANQVLGFAALHPPPPPPPRGIRFALESGATDVRFGSSLAGAQIEEIRLDTAVGRVDLGEQAGVQVGRINVRTTGEIVGRVGVWESIDVHSLVGDINLDLAVVDYPTWAVNATGRPDHERRATHPVEVFVRSGSGDTVVRHVEWAAGREVVEDVTCLVGGARIEMHPRFEGPFSLRTGLGEIEMSQREDVLDPEGQGRERRVAVEKSERAGEKVWFGDITWEGSEAEVGVVAEGVQSKDLEDLSVHGEKRKRVKGLVVRTKVGRVALEL